MTESWEKQLHVRLGYEIHVETISISTDYFGPHTQRNYFYTEQHRDNKPSVA